MSNEDARSNLRKRTIFFLLSLRERWPPANSNLILALQMTIQLEYFHIQRIPPAKLPRLNSTRFNKSGLFGVLETSMEIEEIEIPLDKFP